MSFIPSGFGQSTLVFDILGPGSPAMVTFGHAFNPAQSANANAAAVATSWNAAGSMRFAMDSEATFREVRFLRRSAGGELESGIAIVNLAGGFAVEAASPQVAGLFQKLTGFAGRNRRGRTYVPAFPKPDQGGSYNAASVTNFNGNAATFRTALITNGVPMYLLHGDSGDPPNEVLQYVFVNLVATQRRRIR